MKKVIKRKDVIKALRTEPLRSGAWISTYDDVVYYEADDKRVAKEVDCQVCAVGGILRQAGCTVKQIDNVGYSIGTCDLWSVGLYDEEANKQFDEVVNDLLKKKKYLSALSTYFEHHAEKRTRVTKAFREKLVTFVKKNFPREFVFDTRKQN